MCHDNGYKLWDGIRQFARLCVCLIVCFLVRLVVWLVGGWLLVGWVGG